jgi:hypothetical protein
MLFWKVLFEVGVLILVFVLVGEGLSYLAVKRGK